MLHIIYAHLFPENWKACMYFQRILRSVLHLSSFMLFIYVYVYLFFADTYSCTTPTPKWLRASRWIEVGFCRLRQKPYLCHIHLQFPVSRIKMIEWHREPVQKLCNYSHVIEPVITTLCANSTARCSVYQRRRSFNPSLTFWFDFPHQDTCFRLSTNTLLK